MEAEIFGPVPSRRLGQSIGINHIPPKICTYACRYCQLGKAIRMQSNREAFYPVDDILKLVKNRLNSCGQVDYLSLVPDGEPCLDLNLGELIKGLKSFGIPVAIISNASMLWDQKIREELSLADWVSLKVDAFSESIWRKVDCPVKSLDHQKIKEGMLTFSQMFKGKLVTESMLISGINDEEIELTKMADFIASLNPHTAYLSIPTRPPADTKVKPANEAAIQQAYALYSSKISNVELLIGYEGNAFSASGNAEADILSITAVHPMREDAMHELLKKNNASYELVNRLIQEGKLLKLEFQGHSFYLRKLKT